MAHLHAFKGLLQRVSAELIEASSIMSVAVRDKQLPDIHAIDPSVLRTAMWAVVTVHVVVVLVAAPRLRTWICDTVESVLAVCLLVMLVALVLGLPFGAIYLGLRGMSFLAESLLHSFPRLKSLLTYLISQLGVFNKAAA